MKIEFEAALTGTSAVTFGQDGEAKVRIEIPEIYRAEAVKVAGYAPGKVLKVSFEIEE